MRARSPDDVSVLPSPVRSGPAWVADDGADLTVNTRNAADNMTVPRYSSLPRYSACRGGTLDIRPRPPPLPDQASAMGGIVRGLRRNRHFGFVGHGVARASAGHTGNLRTWDSWKSLGKREISYFPPRTQAIAISHLNDEIALLRTRQVIVSFHGLFCGPRSPGSPTLPSLVRPPRYVTTIRGDDRLHRPRGRARRQERRSDCRHHGTFGPRGACDATVGREPYQSVGSCNAPETTACATACIFVPLWRA